MNKTLSTLCLNLCLSAGVASAALIGYTVHLDGPSEVPVNASPGTGDATVFYDDVAHTLQLSMTFSGLIGTTTASHIHAATPTPFTGTAGVATTTPRFLGFPTGVTSGSYGIILDLTQASSYNPSYVSLNGSIAASELALTNAMAAGEAYLNIHTQFAPGGEIRGFLVATPEPGSIVLLMVGLAGFVVRKRLVQTRLP